MNLTDSFTLKCQCGSPVFLDDICAIFPATLREITEIGYDTFWQYLQVLIAEKPVLDNKDDNELTKLLNGLSDFQYFLVMTSMDQEVNQKAKEAFRFFVHESVTFSLDPAQIVIGPLQEKHLLTEEKFYDLRRILKRMYWVEQQEGEEIIIYEDDLPSVKALKMQMKKNREKVAKAKKKQNSGGSNLKMSDLIASVAVGNCDLNTENIWNITYYAFHDQLKRMGWRDQFNINNRAALAGAKLKKSQLKHWIKSIASDDKS
jgi:hypothetical protein